MNAEQNMNAEQKMQRNIKQKMQRNIRRYSDEKLAKELTFARGFGDCADNALLWLSLLEAEQSRRDS